MTVCTHSRSHGTIFAGSLFGVLTEHARQGFFVMRSSSTAAERMLDTLPNIIRTYVDTPSRPRSQA